jgi:hypothetical protein
MYSNKLIDLRIAKRANSITNWHSLDNLTNYNEVVKKGIISNYKPGDIKYKFNNHGFRCDNFELPSELPIVFLGCSTTEGIGIHQHETWSYLLLENIRKKTNKNIPYWNLGLAGTGIDTQARNLYFLTTLLNIKINFVFGLLPPYYRREYKLENEIYRYWAATIESELPVVNHIFSDSTFATHQSERSLMLIDSICQRNNTKACFTSWDKDCDVSLINKHFPLIDSFSFKFYVHWQDDKKARDGLHPGPEYHQALAEIYWEHIKGYF